MSGLTVDGVKELYASYNSLDDVIGVTPLELLAVDYVFKAERYLTERYQHAAWNTINSLYTTGIQTNDVLLEFASKIETSEEPETIEIYKTFLSGCSIEPVIKRMVLRDFEKIFSLEGFYESTKIY